MSARSLRALVVGAVAARGGIELVANLAREHNLIVAADRGAQICREAGVMPDLMIGDMDSLDRDVLASLSATGIPVTRVPAEKDETDLDLALAVAKEQGATAVTVTCAFTERLDHTLAAVGSLLRYAGLHPRFEEPGQRGWLLSRGSRSEITLSGAGSTVSLLPVAGPACVSVTGVRWPLAQATLDSLSSRGVSNVITAQTARVNLHEGVVLVISAEVDDAGLAQELS